MTRIYEETVFLRQFLRHFLRTQALSAVWHFKAFLSVEQKSK
jgi:hypothetical protein